MICQYLDTNGIDRIKTFKTKGEAKDWAATTHTDVRRGTLGETIMENATEGTIKVTTYWWPRPGMDEPFEKNTRKPVIKFVVSASTKNSLPLIYIRLWHLADVQIGRCIASTEVSSVGTLLSW